MGGKRRRYWFVLRLVGALARVAFGFALACFAAGLVIVMFVNTPADVLSEPSNRLPQSASETFSLALLTATHAAIFAAAFVLISAGLGEWFSIRSLTYYLIAGIAITALGFAAELASEVTGQPTILNAYAVVAFLTTGSFAGFVYWLASGQFAGSPPAIENASTDIIPASANVSTEPAEHGEARSDDNETAIITKPEPRSVQPVSQASLLNRLKFTRRRSGTHAEATDIARLKDEDGGRGTGDSKVSKPTSARDDDNGERAEKDKV